MKLISFYPWFVWFIKYQFNLLLNHEILQVKFRAQSLYSHDLVGLNSEYIFLMRSEIYLPE